MRLSKLFAGLTVAFSTMIATIAHAEELTVATFIPPQHHINAGLFKWFGEEIDKRSGGTLTMQLYPAGQLGAGPVQQYKRVVEGVADIVFGLQAYTPNIFPRSMLIIPPGKATSAEESTKRLLAVFDEHLAQEYKDVKLLGIFTTTGNLWAATRDVSTMEGLKGAKFVPFAAMTTPIFEALGATPVQMPVTEMYTGLSTGTIDATTATYNNVTPPWNFWDVSTHIVKNVPVQFAVFYVLMNKERYESLSDEHRAIIDKLAGETFSLMGAKSFDGADGNSAKAMESAQQMKGINVISASPEERAKMNDAVKHGLEVIFADYESRGIANARDIYQAINQ